MLDRVGHMLKKEFIQLFRDPKMRPVIFIMPVVQLLIFGYAASTDVRHVQTVVYDLDNSVQSRELTDRFSRSGYFDIVAHAQDEREAQWWMDSGKAQFILQMNHGFSQEINGGRSAPLQIIVDGTDSNTARVVLDYGVRIASEYSNSLLTERFLRLQGRDMPARFDMQSRAWFNENLESRDFYVPGVIAMLVLIATLMLTSMAIVREKEIGTMEQIIVTPIRPREFILGKTVPFALIGFFDVILITLVAVFWFDVPIRGSIVLLLGATALYLMTSIGVGLLISTIVSTQQQALMTTFLISFPVILLSGFMFPIANMPKPVQYLTYANPLRYYIVIIRGVFLKGVGFGILWPQLVGLAVIGVTTLTLATKKFHKTLS